jgi:DNA-binding CsgD family transcriptional regulator
MVGREAERILLQEQLASIRSGRGQLVILGGEAGIGKTTLARDLMDTARESGCMVLVGRCFDSTTASPYALWIDLANDYLRVTGDQAGVTVPPALSSSALDGVANQAEFFDLVQVFLQDVSKRQPTLVVLEDVHWADPASLELLRHIAPRMGHDRLLLMVTYRVDELTRQHPFYRYLPALVREAEGLRLDLRRLRDRDLEVLVTTRYGLAADDRVRLVEYLTRHSDGNPFFAMELLRTLEHVEGNGLEHSEAGWRLGELDRVVVPALVTQIIDARVSRLGDAMRESLAIAAVIGQEVPLDLWAKVAGLDDEGLYRLVDAAVESFLMSASPDGGRVSFVHALTREALYESISPPRRRLVHRAVAEALAEFSPSDPDPVAFHFQQAADDRAVTWLIRAGDRAQRVYAWLMAGDRFLAAADLLRDVEGEELTRARLLYRFARLLRYSNNGMGVESMRLAERLAERAGDAFLAADAGFSRGMLHCFGDEFRAGLQAMQAGIERLESLPEDVVRESWATSAWLADALPPVDESHPGEIDPSADAMISAGLSHRRGNIAYLSSVAGYLDRAITEATRFLAMAAGVRSDPMVMSAIGHAEVGLGFAATTQCRAEDARHAYAAARETYGRLEHHGIIAFTYLAELSDCLVPFYTTDREERNRTADEAQLMLERAGGAISSSISSEYAQLVVLYLDGSWNRAWEIAGDRRDHGTFMLRRQALFALAPIARHQGKPDVAWSYVRTVLPNGPETQPGDCVYLDGLMALRLGAELSLDAGELEAAREWLQANDRWLDWNQASLGRAEACVIWSKYLQATGEFDAAASKVAEAVSLGANPHQPLALLSARLQCGQLALERGDVAGASGAFADALALATACDIPFERARVLAAMLALPNLADRQAIADEVRAICDRLGAAPLLARIDQRFPAAIVPSGLTSRELDVLRLAANGLTDAEIGERLFISARTSSQHLRSIYGKLQIHSRAALTRYAIENRLA